MKLMRNALALIAWIILYIPTTVFVILVMISSYIRGRRSRKDEL
jgi:hypothetical protein